MVHPLHSVSARRSVYFLTLNTIDCVDVFIRPVYKQVIVHTLNHFIDLEKMNVLAWCLLSNHLQLLAQISSDEFVELEKEFRSFTTEKVLEAIDTEPEVRRNWLMTHFRNFVEVQGNQLQLWQTPTNVTEVDVQQTDQLLEYFEHIHQEPVRERIVDSPVEYRYSSARDYAGIPGLVNTTRMPEIESRLAVAGSTNGSFLVKYVRGA